MPKSNKTNPPTKALGKFERGKNGAVVLLPPDEQELPAVPTPPTNKQAEVVVESRQSTISVFVEDDKDPSQVTDAESEKLSNVSAKDMAEENKKRAQAASAKLTPKKSGNSVVTEGTYNDVDLPEFQPAQQSQAADEVPSKDSTKDTTKDATDDNEDKFRKEVERVLNETSTEEDFEEHYDDDDQT